MAAAIAWLGVIAYALLSANGYVPPDYRPVQSVLVGIAVTVTIVRYMLSVRYILSRVWRAGYDQRSEEDAASGEHHREDHHERRG